MLYVLFFPEYLFEVKKKNDYDLYDMIDDRYLLYLNSHNKKDNTENMVITNIKVFVPNKPVLVKIHVKICYKIANNTANMCDIKNCSRAPSVRSKQPDHKKMIGGKNIIRIIKACA